MKLSLARPNAILPLEAATDLTGKVGHFVTRNGATVDLARAPADKPFGVLLTDGPAGSSVSVALCSGGLAGTVRVKLGAAVVAADSFLQLDADGCAIPQILTDPSRCVCALALETGALNELIEAALFNPVTLTDLPPEVKTTAFLALAGGRYSTDTTAAAFEATLPAIPVLGDRLYFQDPQGTWDTHNFTLNRNGNQLAGLSEHLVCTTANASLWLEWVGGALGWQVFRNS